MSGMGQRSEDRLRIGNRVPGGCRVQKRRQAGAHSKRFATNIATVNEFRASVWSASSLLALFPAFVGHWDLVIHWSLLRGSPDIGLWTLDFGLSAASPVPSAVRR